MHSVLRGVSLRIPSPPSRYSPTTLLYFGWLHLFFPRSPLLKTTVGLVCKLRSSSLSWISVNCFANFTL